MDSNFIARLPRRRCRGARCGRRGRRRSASRRSRRQARRSAAPRTRGLRIPGRLRAAPPGQLVRSGRSGRRCRAPGARAEATIRRRCLGGLASPGDATRIIVRGRGRRGIRARAAAARRRPLCLAVVAVDLPRDFCRAGIRGSFGVFVKPLEAEFGWDRAASQRRGGAQPAVFGVAQPLIGRLIDRHGPRACLVGSLLRSAWRVRHRVHSAALATLPRLWHPGIARRKRPVDGHHLGDCGALV